MRVNKGFVLLLSQIKIFKLNLFEISRKNINFVQKLQTRKKIKINVQKKLHNLFTIKF